jgi:hypothetical protein
MTIKHLTPVLERFPAPYRKGETKNMAKNDARQAGTRKLVPTLRSLRGYARETRLSWCFIAAAF